MASPAYEFKVRLAGVRRIIKLDSAFDMPGVQTTRPRKRKVVTELRYACSILPVAYFDEFLRALTEEFADRLSNYRPRVPWDELPKKLREAAVYKSLQIMARWPRKRLAEREMFNIYAQLASPGRDADAYVICGKALRETHTNPSPDQIEQIAANVGIKRVFSLASKCLAAYSRTYSRADAIKLELGNIVEARHRAAHGRLTTVKSRGEIEQDIDFLERFAEALQRIFHQHRKSLAAKRR